MDLERLITAYYESLFSSSSPSGYIEALESVETMVTQDMNAALDETPTHDEVRTAVFQMHSTKAPGIDGFHALFY